MFSFLGYKSWRIPSLGSWYIRAFVSVCAQQANEEDLQSLLTQVFTDALLSCRFTGSHCVYVVFLLRRSTTKFQLRRPTMPPSGTNTFKQRAWTRVCARSGSSFPVLFLIKLPNDTSFHPSLQLNLLLCATFITVLRIVKKYSSKLSHH